MTDYYERAGLQTYLDELGFNTVGYGCTTCIGNSGPLPDEVSAAIAEGDLVVCAVLSGNRNFEARIHPEVKANYLASPPLVVAYALAGPDGHRPRERAARRRRPTARDVYLRDIWPSSAEIEETIASSVARRDVLARPTPTSSPATRRGASLPVPEGDLYAWEPGSTYVRQPPYFEGLPREPGAVADIEGARCLVVLGDSVTTDHISPAGSIRRRLAGRPLPASSTASSRATSTRTARAAATTR